MSQNLSTTLRHRRRRSDPMQTYDSLPRPLRGWLAGAALPWSPASCRLIWRKALTEGASPDAILARLDRAEQIALSRDRLTSGAEVDADLRNRQGHAS